MDEAKRIRLTKLLERLGHAIRGAVVDSDEVNHCLAELHSSGWDAVMMLSASMLCREGEPIAGEENLRIDVQTTRPEAEYRLDAADARWLAALGISPTRHRSQPRRALPPLSRPLPPSGDDR